MEAAWARVEMVGLLKAEVVFVEDGGPLEHHTFENDRAMKKHLKEAIFNRAFLHTPSLKNSVVICVTNKIGIGLTWFVIFIDLATRPHILGDE